MTAIPPVKDDEEAIKRSPLNEAGLSLNKLNPELVPVEQTAEVYNAFAVLLQKTDQRIARSARYASQAGDATETNP